MVYFMLIFRPMHLTLFSMKHSTSRRNFMKTLSVAIAAVVIAPALKVQSAFSEMVKMDDPLVKALGYVANAKDAKDRKDKKALCGNCQFYQGDAKAKSGKCQLIPAGEVLTGGWCKSYSPKQKKA